MVFLLDLCYKLKCFLVIGISSNGRTEAFEAFNCGSNPYIPAKQIMNRKIKINFSFLWFDFWVGVYLDRKEKILYICPLPMCVIKIWKE